MKICTCICQVRRKQTNTRPAMFHLPRPYTYGWASLTVLSCAAHAHGAPCVLGIVLHCIARCAWRSAPVGPVQACTGPVPGLFSVIHFTGICDLRVYTTPLILGVGIYLVYTGYIPIPVYTISCANKLIYSRHGEWMVQAKITIVLYSTHDDLT